MSLNRRQFLGRSFSALALLSEARLSGLSNAISVTGLKDAFKDRFFIGTAIPTHVLRNNDHKKLDLIAREFSSITAENAMKWSEIRPRLNQWYWTEADTLVKFGVENRMLIVGHALIWHNQVPAAIFLDKKRKPVSRKTLLTRMEKHISTLLERYKGQIAVWDVVNEAVQDDRWRESQWFKCIGEDYFEQAFRFARTADPNAHLIYNDYGMDNPGKQKAVIQAVKDCKKHGVIIDGVGMQSHVHLDGPSLQRIENAILAFSGAGLRVHITELDVDVLPEVNSYGDASIATNVRYLNKLDPYTEGLPQEVEAKLTRRYEDLFSLYIKHREKIERVTLWGTSDDDSWKNNWPVKGRTNYPLLFDRSLQPKSAYHAISRL